MVCVPGGATAGCASAQETNSTRRWWKSPVNRGKLVNSVRGMTPAPMRKKFFQGCVLVYRKDSGQVGKDVGEGRVPTELAPLHQHGGQRCRHRLGVRAEVPHVCGSDLRRRIHDAHTGNAGFKRRLTAHHGNGQGRSANLLPQGINRIRRVRLVLRAGGTGTTAGSPKTQDREQRKHEDLDSASMEAGFEMAAGG
jgi:hypothetical protein